MINDIEKFIIQQYNNKIIINIIIGLQQIHEKNKKCLRYTNREHIDGKKKLLQNKTGINNIDNYLSKYNSKTSDYHKFKKYKNEINYI